MERLKRGAANCKCKTPAMKSAALSPMLQRNSNKSVALSADWVYLKCVCSQKENMPYRHPLKLE